VRRLPLIYLLFGILVADCRGQSAPLPISTGPVVITIGAVDPVVAIGSVIKIKIILKNVADFDIDANGDLGVDCSYTYIVRNGTGTLVLPDTASHRDTGSYKFHLLHPGEVTGADGDLRGYSLPPGKYSVQAERMVTRHSDPELQGFLVRSNEIEITVAPKTNTPQ